MYTLNILLIHKLRIILFIIDMCMYVKSTISLMYLEYVIRTSYFICTYINRVAIIYHYSI